MTVDLVVNNVRANIRDLAARFSFPHAAIRTELRVVTEYYGEALVVSLHVMDRERCLDIIVNHRYEVPFNINEEVAISFIEAAVSKAWTHEFLEAMHFDGVRYKDPHR